MCEISKKDVEMEKNEIKTRNEVSSTNKKAKSKSLETRVRTAVVEKLHLTKVITPVGATLYVRKRVDGKVKMVAESIYSYDASVLNTGSPYSEIVVHSSSEQDAMKKLNEKLYEMVLNLDYELYKKVYTELMARDLKKRGITEELSTTEKDEEPVALDEPSANDAA